MLRRLVIFGAGGHGREILQLLRDINRAEPRWKFEGFLVDPAYSTDTAVQGCPVLGDVSWLQANPDVSVVVAVGSSAARCRITAAIRQRYENQFATLVHPLAWIGDHVSIGAGSVVCAGCLVTTDVVIGEHVHVNIACTLSHDVTLADFVTLSPRVSLTGNVRVGQGAEIGAGSVVIPKMQVGEWAILGAGAVVNRPVPANATAVGVPARVISEREPGWQHQ